jgi:hypothetical protein
VWLPTSTAATSSLLVTWPTNASAARMFGTCHDPMNIVIVVGGRSASLKAEASHCRAVRVRAAIGTNGKLATSVPEGASTNLDDGIP